MLLQVGSRDPELTFSRTAVRLTFLFLMYSSKQKNTFAATEERGECNYMTEGFSIS